MSTHGPEKFGADPVNLQWRVVRGDTATLKVEFFEDNEEDLYSTSGWTYKATAYDQASDTLDDLDISFGNGYVIITAPAETTANWGTKYASNVAELMFDLRVTINASGDKVIWTPVVGTIYVIGNVTPSGTL
jgi:hypothetical protein